MLIQTYTVEAFLNVLDTFKFIGGVCFVNIHNEELSQVSQQVAFVATCPIEYVDTTSLVCLTIPCGVNREGADGETTGTDEWQETLNELTPGLTRRDLKVLEGEIHAP